MAASTEGGRARECPLQALPLSRSKTEGDGEPGISPTQYPSARAIYDSIAPIYSVIQHLLSAYCMQHLCPALGCGFYPAGHRKPLLP